MHILMLLSVSPLLRTELRKDLNPHPVLFSSDSCSSKLFLSFTTVMKKRYKNTILLKAAHQHLYCTARCNIKSGNISQRSKKEGNWIFFCLSGTYHSTPGTEWKRYYLLVSHGNSTADLKDHFTVNNRYLLRIYHCL